MKITQINCYRLEIPYRATYVTATNHTTTGKHIVIQVLTSEGITGWGETGIISRNYPAQGDSPEAIIAVLQHYLGPAILGTDPTEIDVLMQKLDNTIRGNYFAKAAIDHALFDITGKTLNVSAAKLLGGMHRSPFKVSRSLPLAAPEIVAARAEELVKAGYECLTLKCGIDPRNDIASFIATRKAVGDAIALEIDPNGGYDRSTAIRVIHELEQWNLAAVEQPVAGADITGMAEIRSKISTKLIVDESVFNQDDLRQVIEQKAADVICLKPFKSGGLLASKKLQHIAEAFHLELSTGSMHPFGIGTAALQQFVCAMPQVTTTGYGAPLERFTDDIVESSCCSFSKGEVTVSEMPGLGVEVGLKKLKKYTKQTIIIK